MPDAPLALTPEELAGDVPMVCVRSGNPADDLVPVWFARAPRWAWGPLAALAAWAAITTDWAPLASWWAAAAIALPLLTSRAVTGTLPLDLATRQRIAALRSRRARVVLLALLLTWVSVGLWLLGSRAGGLLVLALVLGLYAVAVAMAITGRRLGVRGTPAGDGGALLIDVHPGFADALDLHRTGHRP